MAKDDLVPILERMREQLVDFHQVVARAHERALMRIQEQATRQLRWLGLLAHELAEDTWYGKLTALLEWASGLPTTALESSALTPAALAEAARAYWQGPSFPEAVAHLVSRQATVIEDLQAIAQVLAVFLDELGRAAVSLHVAPSSEADGAGGEAR